MTSVAAINISFDPASQAWLSEFTRRLSLLAELVPCPAEIVDLVKRIPRAELVSMFKFVPTAGTLDRRIVLEPSHALLELMSAFRTLQGEGDLFADRRHDALSTETPSLSPHPAEVMPS